MAEFVVLTALARAGYQEFGRGAVIIDFAKVLDLTVFYAHRELIERGLVGEGKRRNQEILDDYNPLSELIVVVIDPVGCENLHHTETFWMEQWRAGSTQAQRIADLIQEEGLITLDFE